MSQAFHGVMIITGIAWALLLLTYFAAVYLNFYSLVDAVWSFCFSAAALVCLAASGFTPRLIVFSAMTILWSVRLGWHLAVRLRSQYPKEDTRYLKLKSAWSRSPKISFFLFYQAQALTFIVLGVPLALVAANAHRPIGLVEVSAALLWFAAVTGEALADAQLKAFKAEPLNRKRVCDAGLWKYSRHPNYFFEWLIWCAFALYALPGHGGWLALAAPAAMYVLLVHVSGVPPSEEQSMRSRGEDYASYQSRTNRFFPWFPKQEVCHAR